MVVVLVVDRELAKFLALKFSPAACTDPRKNLERFLPVPLLSLLMAAADLGHNPVESIWVQAFFL